MAEPLIDDELAERDLLACAARTVETIDNLEGYADAMSQIATRYAAAGQYEFAVELAETINDPYTRDKTLADVAASASQAGDDEYGFQIIETIEDPSFVAFARSQIASERAGQGEFDAALEMAYELDDSSATLADIAIKCAARGEHVRALEIVSTIEYPASAAYALNEMAGQHIKEGRTEEALSSLSDAESQARSIELPEDSASLLVESSLKYAEAGEQGRAEEVLQEALRLAETVEIMRYREGALAHVSYAYARLGLSFQAREVAGKIEDCFHGAQAFTNIAVEQVRRGEHSDALKTLARARQLIIDEEVYEDPNYPQQRWASLMGVAVGYAGANDSEQALQTANMIEADEYKTAALVEIARSYSTRRAFDLSLQTARALEDPFSRSTTLAFAGEALIKDGEEERGQAVLAEAKRAAEEIEYGQQKAAALIELARKQSAAERAGEASRLLLDALRTIAASESRYDKALGLAHLSDAYRASGQKIDDEAKEILSEIVSKLD